MGSIHVLQKHATMPSCQLAEVYIYINIIIYIYNYNYIHVYNYIYNILRVRVDSVVEIMQSRCFPVIKSNTTTLYIHVHAYTLHIVKHYTCSYQELLPLGASLAYI